MTVIPEHVWWIFVPFLWAGKIAYRWVMNCAIKIVQKVCEIQRDIWDGLLGSGSPLMKWDWLDSFEQTGCVNEKTGWLPHHLVVEMGGRLSPSVPCISNSTAWESLFLTGNGRRRHTGSASSTTPRC